MNTFIQLDFKTAKAKHLHFKSLLRSILYGISHIDETLVVSHKDCAVGRWIYDHAIKEYHHIPEIHELEDIHKQIHTKARGLVELYKSGKEDEARLGLVDLEIIADRLIELLTEIEDKLTASGTEEYKEEAESIRTSFNELKSVLLANKQLDEQIRDQASRMLFITESMPQMIWTADENGNITYLNQKWLEYTGFPLSEIKTCLWSSLIHHEDILESAKKWQNALISGTDFKFEQRLLRADGEYKWHLTIVNAKKNEDGKVVMWVCTNTDIHENKLLEFRKDEFLSIASHELKTPLTSIKAYAQMIPLVNDIEKVHSMAYKCIDQSNKLERLISDLLTISKVNAGKMIFDKKEFDFAKLISECIESTQHSLSTHKIIVESTTEVLFNGDKIRLEQVLNNLLNNAIKYSPPGSDVIVKSDIVEKNLVVSVQDFGIGIEPESLSKLFERYYRVDNVAMRYQGLGLGLYIAGEILKNHNGIFWVESELGKGSTFYIQLPLVDNLITNIETDDATYYHTNKVTIDYIPEKQLLQADWNGFQNIDTVLNGGLKMIDLVSKTKVTKVLNDNTGVLGNWGEASGWGATHFFPLIEKAGCKYFAWIYSPSTFAQLAAQKSSDAVVSNNIALRFFNNPDEAILWLESV